MMMRCMNDDCAWRGDLTSGRVRKGPGGELVCGLCGQRAMDDSLLDTDKPGDSYAALCGEAEIPRSVVEEERPPDEPMDFSPRVKRQG